MKGINKTMNHIVEEEKKDELTSHIELGYKVIYPNKNVKIKLVKRTRTRYDEYETSHHIKSGLNCWGIGLIDRFTKYRNDLFLIPCDFSDGYNELRISRAGVKADFNLGPDVQIYSGEKYLGSKTKFHEKIKYILFYQNTGRLRILIDDNFKTKAAQKHERNSKEKRKLEEELDLDLS